MLLLYAWQVLIMDKGNAKALFRRGRARHQLQQTEQAEADLQAASQLDPGDRAIATELQAVRQSLRADRQAQSKMFKGRLKPDPAQPDHANPREAPTGSVASWWQAIIHRIQIFFASLWPGHECIDRSDLF